MGYGWVGKYDAMNVEGPGSCHLGDKIKNNGPRYRYSFHIRDFAVFFRVIGVAIFINLFLSDLKATREYFIFPYSIFGVKDS